MRWGCAIAALALLLVGGCVLSVGSTIASLDGSKPRIVNAPPGEVFEALREKDNWIGFEKITDSATTTKYQIPLTEENMASMGQSRSSGAGQTFKDGKLTVTIKPDERMIIELVSKDYASRVRFTMHFVEDTTHTKTLVTADTEVKDDDLDAADEQKMEKLYNLMAGVVMKKFIDQVEKQL
jgi:hypothetical protein